jgi:hypothetical protein
MPSVIFDGQKQYGRNVINLLKRRRNAVLLSMSLLLSPLDYGLFHTLILSFRHLGRFQGLGLFPIFGHTPNRTMPIIQELEKTYPLQMDKNRKQKKEKNEGFN